MIDKIEGMGTAMSDSGLGCGMLGRPQSEPVMFSFRMSKSFAEFGRMRKSSLVVPSKQSSIPIANTASGEPENNLQFCPTTIACDEMNRYKAETALNWSDEMFSDEWLLRWWTVCAKQPRVLLSTTHDAHRRRRTNTPSYSKSF